MIGFARAHRESIDTHMRKWNETRRNAHRNGHRPEPPTTDDTFRLHQGACVMRF